MKSNQNHFFICFVRSLKSLAPRSFDLRLRTRWRLRRSCTRPDSSHTRELRPTSFPRSSTWFRLLKCRLKISDGEVTLLLTYKTMLKVVVSVYKKYWQTFYVQYYLRSENRYLKPVSCQIEAALSSEAIPRVLVKRFRTEEFMMAMFFPFQITVLYHIKLSLMIY
jgi:hypothetical protein